MILATRQGNVELRAEWGTDHIIPRPGYSWISSAGQPVTELAAYGIPAVSNVIRSPAALIASMPFFVYRDGETREAARDIWQWELLHDQPSEYCSSYEFYYDLALSMEACQNAFIRKIRGIGSRRNRLEELVIVDPHRVKVHQEAGEKLFDIYVDNKTVIKNLTNRDVLHIKGFNPNPGALAGMSLIELHKNSLGSGIAMLQFEGDYFKNSGVPPFWFTGASNADHAKQIIDSHTAAHAGQGNRFKPGAVWGNLDVKSIPISLSDADYVSVKQLSVEDVCRIWRWPKEWVEAPTENVTGSDNSARTAELLKIYVYPRLRLIERAFAADRDLFTAGLYGEFLTSALERADFVTRVRGYKDARQGGWITANEIRHYENLPPLPEGDELQVTPVGGAPNPSSTNEETP